SVRLDPEDALGWYNLANALYPLAVAEPGGRIVDRAAAERCAEAARRAQALEGVDPPTLLLLGRIEGALGRPGESRPALRRASEIDPRGPYGAEAQKILDRAP